MEMGRENPEGQGEVGDRSVREMEVQVGLGSGNRSLVGVGLCAVWTSTG